MIDDYVREISLFDRQATIAQILSLRYGELENQKQIVEVLAKMPSNEMLRLVLTCSPEEMAQILVNSPEDITENHHPKDLFTVSGPIEGYYRDKKIEQKALELLAEFRFGEVNKPVKSSIKYLLQAPLHISMRKVYSLTRSELIKSKIHDE
jgi:hypothetical protein